MDNALSLALLEPLLTEPAVTVSVLNEYALTSFLDWIRRS